MSNKQHNTGYTLSVNELNNNIYSPGLRTASLYQQAKDYFASAGDEKRKLAQLEQHLEQKKDELLNASARNKAAIKVDVNSLGKRFKDAKTEQKNKRLYRLNCALETCLKILVVTESDNFEDTQLRSAKFLGTVMLLSPGRGKTLSELHQRFKPAYKVVLCLRLLDKLVNEGHINQSYILEYYDAEHRYLTKDSLDIPYIQSVILPVMLAALFQDVGFQHPDVISILKGDGSLDEFRTLEPEERKSMLKLSYQHAMDYAINGLGCQSYKGNSKVEKTQFDNLENKRLKFQVGLLKDASIPKLGIGDIIKIPQVYTSVVLPTKRNFVRKDLPKAARVIEQLSENKSVNQKVAEAFISIVGYFPQGYGVTLIPKNLQGSELDSYEYGVVSRLNPTKVDEPICKIVTRSLAYISSGQTNSITKQCNLHFAIARKKLSKVESSRLIEIMQTLSHSFNPKDIESLIPQMWEPYEYFSSKKNQNLWNRST